MIFQSIHPYDQSVIAEYPIIDGNTLQKRLESASEAFEEWRTSTMQQRSDLLKLVAAGLRAKRDDFARLITLEMGKILSESRAEVEKCALCCDFYAAYAETYLRDEVLTTDKPPDMRLGKVVYEPLGVIFAIMPWNYPFWQVFRFAVPSLMAGNVALLKHAPNVVGCAVAIEKIFVEAASELGANSRILG